MSSSKEKEAGTTSHSDSFTQEQLGWIQRVEDATAQLEDLFLDKLEPTKKEEESIVYLSDSMFKGDPPKPPKFCFGDHLLASSDKISNDGWSCIQDKKPEQTVAKTPFRAKKKQYDDVPPLVMPADAYYVVQNVKRSNGDGEEHRYIIRPRQIPTWEVSESQLLQLPLRPAEHVVQKRGNTACVNLVKSVFAQVEKVEVENDIGDDWVEAYRTGPVMEMFVHGTTKAMMRIVDEMNEEHVVEADKYRLANLRNGEVYFPIKK